MDLLISAAVWIALTVVGLKVFFWARKRNKAAKTAWRRRMGLILFFLPVLLFLGRWLLPEPVQPVIRGISIANAYMDQGLKWVIGAAKQEAPGVFSLAVTPVVYALFYTALGILIGWPLDALKKARAGDEPKQEQPADGAEPPPADGAEPPPPADGAEPPPADAPA